MSRFTSSSKKSTLNLVIRYCTILVFLWFEHTCFDLITCGGIAGTQGGTLVLATKNLDVTGVAAESSVAEDPVASTVGAEDPVASVVGAENPAGSHDDSRSKGESRAGIRLGISSPLGERHVAVSGDPRPGV